MTDEIQKIKDFDDKLDECKWLDRYQEEYIPDLLETPEGKHNFDDFLKLMRSAPNLLLLPQEADDTVRLLLMRSRMEMAVDDLFWVGRDNSEYKDKAKFALELLSCKGYPRAQSRYAEVLMREGGIDNLGKAVKVLKMRENNLYGEKTDETYNKEQCKKRIDELQNPQGNSDNQQPNNQQPVGQSPKDNHNAIDIRDAFKSEKKAENSKEAEIEKKKNLILEELIKGRGKNYGLG